MFDIGPEKLLIILVLALLVVGPKRLPEIGRAVGRALREFRKALDEVSRTVGDALDEPLPASPGSSQSLPDEKEAPQEPSAPAQPIAGEPVATEVARTLGRSLAELRRAGDELRRAIRLDPEEQGPRSG